MYKKQNILQINLRYKNDLILSKQNLLKPSRGTSAIIKKSINSEPKNQEKNVKMQKKDVSQGQLMIGKRTTYLKQTTNVMFQKSSSNYGFIYERQKQKQRSQNQLQKQKQSKVFNNFFNLFDNLELKRKQFYQRSKEWENQKSKQKILLQSNNNQIKIKQNNDTSKLNLLPQNKQNYYQKNNKANKNTLKPNGLIGLSNIGNTCFMNSTLQCIFNIPNFNQYFLQNKYKHQIKQNGKVAQAYAKLIKSIRSSNNKSQTPVLLKNALSSRNTTFKGYAQQDSQQLLVTLLQCLNQDLSRVDKKKVIYKQLVADLKKFSLQQISDDWWKYYKQRDDSIIQDYFTGQLLSQVKCLKCDYVSIAFDNFWDLSLSFLKQSNDISKMIEHFLKQQILNDDYFCSNCKLHRKSKRKTSIYRLPNVLIIQLKRFSYGKWKNQKINSKVIFPDLLDLSKFVKQSKDKSVLNSNYRLIGVVNHSGGIDFGHYTAQCRNPFNKRWYNYNDGIVSQSDYNQKSVYQSSSPYLLFYYRS